MAWEQQLTSWVQWLYELNGPFFDGLFLTLTFLAESTFLLVLVFGIYWCVDKRRGETLLLSLFASLMVNSILKDVVRRPRPFLTDGYTVRYVGVDNGLVDTLSLEHSWSFPSGHSQCAGSVYTTLALWVGRWWGWLLAALAIVGVMTSRVYLGVHFPGDVLVGAALGMGVSALCWWLMNRFYQHRLLLFGLVALLSLPALLLSPTADTVKTMGVGIGGVIGLWIEQRFVHFSTDLTLPKRLLRLAVGGGLLMTAYLLLKLIFPATLPFSGLRYGIVGLLATGILPWVFVRCKI